jgi:hypothetical protein
MASTLLTGVLCVKAVNSPTTTVSSHRLEFSSKPTAIMWHPKIDGDFEDRYKLLYLTSPSY